MAGGRGSAASLSTNVAMVGAATLGIPTTARRATRQTASPAVSAPWLLVVRAAASPLRPRFATRRRLARLQAAVRPDYVAALPVAPPSAAPATLRRPLPGALDDVRCDTRVPRWPIEPAGHPAGVVALVFVADAG